MEEKKKKTSTAAKTALPRTKKTAKTSAANVSVEVKQKKKILIAASECAPYFATGGLADVIGSLPTALYNTGEYDVRVVCPLYQGLKPQYKETLRFLECFNVPLSWRNLYCGVFTTQKDGVIYYFIDNEYYFKRSGFYGFYDDGERFAYFAKAIIEMMPHIDFIPDVLHCNDWQTALCPVYLKTNYTARPEFADIKTVFTIHNIEYQGKYDHSILEDVFGIDFSHASLLDYDGCANVMKAAIVTADRVSTVSPQYAVEIRDKYYAHGLEYIIQDNAHKLTGILNGIDVVSYNPETDPALFTNFSAADMSGKAVCKAELQRLLGLPVKNNVPLIALISRLATHKGIDLIRAVGEKLLEEDVQFVILGTGEKEYESYFAELAANNPEKMVSINAFNQDMARKIYSAADLYLMPSKSEPCGLSQMIASRYGAVPIVRETGGLFDSIKPFAGDTGNGYTFKNYNAGEMLSAIKQALNEYADPILFEKRRLAAITADFTWDQSAKVYAKLYNSLID
ncbi:MAG: glycogen synthase GlgA [Clostridia bacterium]|nr:glycogen synthase GlgA [Clostridia bacterium]